MIDNKTDGQHVSEMRALANTILARLEGGMSVENLKAIAKQAAALARQARKVAKAKAELPWTR